MTAFMEKLRKKTGWLSLLQLALLFCALGTFFLPALIAQFGSAGYYVRGVDMIFGREVPGDRWGMVPMASVMFAGLLLCFGVLSSLIRNRDKAAFLPTLCSLLSLTLLIANFAGLSDTNMVRQDPVLTELFSKNLKYGYYMMMLACLLVLLSGVLRIMSRPKMLADLTRQKWVYIMATPVLIYVLIFFYYPLYGTLMAFKDYTPRLGIFGSPWVGFQNFISFFESVHFFRVIRNTLLISLYTLAFGFPAPILFALLLNEVRKRKFVRVVQTLTYLPHFISLVVVCGLLHMFLSGNGLINQVLGFLGKPEGEMVNFLGIADNFRTIYVASEIWKTFGWNSIIYFAAISSIDQQLYEAAEVDGAKRFRKIWHITLPCLAPTIIIMFILAVGQLMGVGHEKIILLYNPNTYSTADVITSYVYRRGLVDGAFSFASAVGLFNAVIGLTLMLITNNISRRVSETSLW